jgi:hypothetical protein
MRAGDGAQLTVEECTCSRIAEGSLDAFGAGTSLQVLASKFKDCGMSQSPVTTGHGTLGMSKAGSVLGRSNSNNSSQSAPADCIGGSHVGTSGSGNNRRCFASIFCCATFF